jgi:hypothetical protein
VDFESLKLDEHVYDHPWALCQDAADEEGRRTLVDAALRTNGKLYLLLYNYHQNNMK